MKKNIIWIIVIIALIAILAFLGWNFYKSKTEEVINPIVTMEVEGYGTIKMELYPDKAHETVANFIKLIQDGHYNGKTFYRTIPEFMIQAGSRDESLDYSIKGEFVANGYSKNDLKFEAGVIGMARADYSDLGLTEEGYNSGSADFFITHVEYPSLNGYYTAFGKVIEGMDVVDKIANVEVQYRDTELGENEEIPTDENGNEIPSDNPKEEPVISSMTVDTFGIDYGEPEKLTPFDYNRWIYEQYGIDLNNVTTDE